MATDKQCECGSEGNCWHLCRVKKKGYVGAAQVKTYLAEQKFVCEKCGAKNPAGTAFCGECGKKL